MNYINRKMDSIPLNRRSSNLGIIINESGGNPRAIDDSGQFIGLFQWDKGGRYEFPEGYENMTDYELIDHQL